MTSLIETQEICKYNMPFEIDYDHTKYHVNVTIIGISHGNRGIIVTIILLLGRRRRRNLICTDSHSLHTVSNMLPY